MATCDRCGRSFLNQYNLKLHVKNAAYCKKIAETQTHQIEQTLQQLQTKNAELEAKNAELQAKNAELHAKLNILTQITQNTPITQNNTQNNNTQNNNLVIRPHPKDNEAREKLVPLTATVASLQKLAEETFTTTHFLEGEAGIARWMNESLRDLQGRPMYICTDASRLTMKFMDPTGKICIDTGGKLLTMLIGKAISTRVTSIYTGYVHHVRNFQPSESVLEQHLRQLNSDQQIENAQKIYSKLQAAFSKSGTFLRLYGSLNSI